MASNIEKEVLVTKIAGLIAAGAEVNSISKELGVTPQKVRYIRDLPETRDKVNELVNSVMGDIVKEAKRGLAKLLPKAIRAIDRRLEEDADLKAAELVLKGVGALKEEETNNNATSITVVMPGQEAQEVINISPNVGNDET
jgi:hypothetical protein